MNILIGKSIEYIKDEHRKEKKNLKSKIQYLKKQAQSSDKKKRKEINSEIEKLEKEFDDKCSIELLELQNNSIEKSKYKIMQIKNSENKSFELSSTKQSKISKAQKRRDKKTA